MPTKHDIPKGFGGPAISRRPPKSARGFTLIELAIAMTISGLIIAAIFGAMNQNKAVKSAQMTQIMDSLLLGTAEYYRIYGTYPCPADPTLVRGDANFGEPDADASGACQTPPALRTPGIGGGTVVIGAVPVRALNRAMGCAPTDSSLLPDNLKQTFQNKLNTARQIFFGSATSYENYSDYDEDDPSAQKNYTETSRKCISDALIHDIYGSKFTYAVNLGATQLDDTEPVGNIEVVNRANQPVTTELLNFVIVSHGPDRKGAYPADGSAPFVACGTGVSPDDENCNNNALFRAAYESPMPVPYDANHYDDRVEYSLTGYARERDMWRWSKNSDPNKRNLVFEGKPNQPLTIGIPQSTPPTDEKIGVYGGDMRVDGDLTAQGATGASTATVKALEDMKADKNIEIDHQASAPQFCYDPPLTASCVSP